jgi:hypothetical protein
MAPITVDQLPVLQAMQELIDDEAIVVLQVPWKHLVQAEIDVAMIDDDHIPA